MTSPGLGGRACGLVPHAADMATVGWRAGGDGHGTMKPATELITPASSSAARSDRAP